MNIEEPMKIEEAILYVLAERNAGMLHPDTFVKAEGRIMLMI